MIYSTEPKYEKYIEDHGSLSFARKVVDKNGKKWMDNAVKQEQLLQRLLLKE